MFHSVPWYSQYSIFWKKQSFMTWNADSISYCYRLWWQDRILWHISNITENRSFFLLSLSVVFFPEPWLISVCGINAWASVGSVCTSEAGSNQRLMEELAGPSRASVCSNDSITDSITITYRNSLSVHITGMILYPVFCFKRPTET